MKTCNECGQEKDIEDFHKRSDTGKPRSACKVCVNAKNLKRYFTNPETKTAHRTASRKHALKKYGLTPAALEHLLATQDNSCAICEKSIRATDEDRFQVACVDHCHETGNVRGLLCFACNVGLGKFHDSPALLAKAAKYLKVNQSSETL
jgi:hypothetical protein